ncbi:MAG: FtsQ-type POTRA domain-containing protein [Calditrichaeota bacterium]|nr:MAG: FtsQ-type POTRA domain-containing protein [Calditrichota bacterium]
MMMVYSTYRSRTRRKRRTVHKSRRVSFRRVGLGVLVLTTTLYFLLRIATWLNARELFVLKDIRVEGNRVVATDDILAKLTVESSQNLLDLDLRRLAERVKAHPLIEDAHITRRLPSTLLVSVREKKPVALIEADGLAPIDEHGSLLPEYQGTQQLDYPVITDIDYKDPRQKPALDTVLAFLNRIRRDQFTLYSEISEVSYSPNAGIYFYLNSGAIPVVVGNGNFSEKGAHLMAVIQLLQAEQKFSGIEYFDLRFDNQVVVKESVQS